MSCIAVLFLLTMAYGTCLAQTAFSRLNTSFPGVTLSAVAWGDFDNDGKLDIALVGNGGLLNGYIAQIWRNVGDGTFSQVNVALPGLFKSSLAWGDYDKDGRLDLMLAGMDANFTPVCQVWHNQGDGTFVKSGILLPGISGGVVAWGDLDNDGDPDVLLSGADAAGKPLTQIWRNQGGGSFVNMNAGLTPLVACATALGDLDNDGRIDIVLTGTDANNNRLTLVYRNNGNGSFLPMSTPMPGVYAGALALGDYDNDGKIDILLNGIDKNGAVLTQLWHNQGNFSFTNANESLPKISNASLAWGDFDNDGKLDLLISGYDATRLPITQIWRNTGGGAFSNLGATLTGIASGKVAVGDYDNDGKLDVLLAGSSPLGFVTQIWRNSLPQSNAAPLMPSGLQATLTSSGALLTWNAPSDEETPASGLTYNLRLGTAPGRGNIIPAGADSASGLKRLPDLGNVLQNRSVALALPPGVYYWSVQAVDKGYAGSAFAAESTFAVKALVTTKPATQIGFTSAQLNGTVNPRGVATVAWFRWGTTTSYGNNLTPQNVGNGVSASDFSQAVLSLQPGTTYHYSLVATDSFGVSYSADQSFTTPSRTPPALSDFQNVSTASGTPTPPIPFTVSSSQIAADALSVAVTASDLNLVPPGSLILGGSGTSRTLTIQPAQGRQGATAITVSVSDGSSVTTKSFLLNVGLVPGDLNGDGIVDQDELDQVLSNYWAHSPWISMSNFTRVGTGTTFQFALTNASAWDFTVLVSSDLVNWSVLPNRATPLYQFSDPQAATNSLRKYRLRWP